MSTEYMDLSAFALATGAEELLGSGSLRLSEGREEDLSIASLISSHRPMNDGSDGEADDVARMRDLKFKLEMFLLEAHQFDPLAS